MVAAAGVEVAAEAAVRNATRDDGRDDDGRWFLRSCVRLALGTRSARLSPRSLWVARPSLRSAGMP